jgi:hypothetical protein
MFISWSGLGSVGSSARDEIGVVSLLLPFDLTKLLTGSPGNYDVDLTGFIFVGRPDESKLLEVQIPGELIYDLSSSIS